MPPRPTIIGPAEVYRYAATQLHEQLRWRDHGPKCTAQRVLQVLFYAAASLCSVFAACRRLRDTPSDQAVRDAVQALCPEVHPLEAQLNAALAGQLPKALRRRRQRLAIDLTLVPYHGQPQRRVEELYRSQAKSGTTWFHAYASAYVVQRGRRYTVAMMAVERGIGMKAVLRHLLHVAGQAGVRPGLLLLDRGFYSVEVIRYLQAARLPFLMPVVIRGRRASDPRGPGGTRVFAARQRSGWARYTLTNAARQRATVAIGIHCRNGRGRRGRRGRQTLVYAYWGLCPRTTQWLYQTYRLRFGIETRYRQLREARIRTTTRSPARRLLFVGIALLLRNVWVWVHWHDLATPRRGGRQLHLDRLPFKTLLMWLTHLAEQTFGVNDHLVIEPPG